MKTSTYQIITWILAIAFIILVIIDLILGCIFLYKAYKNNQDPTNPTTSQNTFRTVFIVFLIVGIIAIIVFVAWAIMYFLRSRSVRKNAEEFFQTMDDMGTFPINMEE